jgi:hypothetical protein
VTSCTQPIAGNILEARHDSGSLVVTQSSDEFLDGSRACTRSIVPPSPSHGRRRAANVPFENVEKLTIRPCPGQSASVQRDTSNLRSLPCQRDQGGSRGEARQERQEEKMPRRLDRFGCIRPSGRA